MKHVNLVGKIAAIFYFLSVGGLFADTAVYRQVGGTTGGNTSYNDAENWYKPGTSPAELFEGVLVQRLSYFFHKGIVKIVIVHNG